MKFEDFNLDTHLLMAIYAFLEDEKEILKNISGVVEGDQISLSFSENLFILF